VKLNPWKSETSQPASNALSPATDWALLDPRAIFAVQNRTHWESEFRRLTFNAAMAKDAVLCRILGRYKMLVSNADEGLGPHLIGDGYWEVWTTRFIAQHVRPGMVCIDAGANLGYYTVLMADMCGPNGRVIAAEPVPETRGFLTRNVALNGFSHHVEIRPEAFGAEAGEVSIAIPRGEPKNALVEFGDTVLHPGWEWDTIKTPMMRIDDLDLPRVDFMKIDVEGAEEALWRGMSQTLDRSPDVQIVMEVNYPRYPDPEAFFADIARRFPLRRVDFGGEAAPITVEEIRNANDDVMLYLSRN
jgi:FkbM family methyltransferase